MTTQLLYDVKIDGSPEIGKTLPIIRTRTGADKTVLVATKTKTCASKELPSVKENCQNGLKQATKRYQCKLSVTKTCFCGNTFTAKREDAVFCSPRCRMKAMRENKQLRMI